MATFRTLFEVEISHNYFANDKVRGISVLPCQESAHFIKSRRLLFRNTDSGFKVSHRTLNESPFLALNDFTLNFIIYFNNVGEFLNYSKLKDGNKSPGSNSVLFFRNNDESRKNLDFSLLDAVRSSVFDYTFPFEADDPPNDEADFEIEDVFGQNILTVEDISCDEMGIYQFRVDLLNQPPGRYIFKSSDENHEVVSEVIYVDSVLYRQRPFGLIQIKYNENTRSDYKVKFKRNTSKWTYYVVNKSGISLDDYNLLINDESGDDGTGVYSTYAFTGSQTPDPDNSINGFETLTFVSNKKIPFYEVPKFNIKLKKLEVTAPLDSAEVLMAHLPNPKLDGIINSKNESEIMVFI